MFSSRLCYDERIIRALHLSDSPNSPPRFFDADAFLARLDAAALAQGDAPTRALVVVNVGDAPRSGRVRFHAAFPVRASVGAQPVAVRDADGTVVPSRLKESTLDAHADVANPGSPTDRLWWTLTLEFVVTDVPARGWRTYAATFARASESRAEDADFRRDLPDADLPVWETDCHDGDIPATGHFADLPQSVNNNHALQNSLL